MAATKQDYFEPGVGSNFNSVRGDYKSQSFQASSTYTIDKVVLYLESSNSNAITYYVRLYVADGNGLPTGGILATFGTFTITSLQSSYTEEEFDSDSYEVTSGNDYCIVCEADSDPNTTWRWFATSSNDYATGNAATKGFGFGWVARTYDNWFQLWEDDVALPGKPITPSPAHEASDIGLNDTTATWESGGNTDSYNIYYGTLSGFLDLVVEGVTDLEQVLIEGAYGVYNRITYWRVDAVNDIGTTQGDEWSFTTLAFEPVLPSGMSLDGDGNPTGTPNGLNNIITIHKLVAAADNTIWYEDI